MQITDSIGCPFSFALFCLKALAVNTLGVSGTALVCAYRYFIERAIVAFLVVVLTAFYRAMNALISVGIVNHYYHLSTVFILSPDLKNIHHKQLFKK